MQAKLIDDSHSWALTEEDFLEFRDLIKDRAGISLTPAKKDLVRTRLRARVQALGMGSFSDYRRFLRTLAPGHDEWQKFVNLLTTNKTDFFREPQHFDFLMQSFLPAWLESGEKELKIWSCACSTGEEPYTLSMVLAQAMPPGRRYSILATDIDTNVLATAQNGVYPEAKLSDIPEPFRRGAVLRGMGEAAGWFRIEDRIRDRIEFGQHNLMEEALPGQGPFDLVFCRNVLIYFNRETVHELAKKLYQAVREDGLLFTGHSESLQGCEAFWAGVQPAVYRKAGRR